MTNRELFALSPQSQNQDGLQRTLAEQVSAEIHRGILRGRYPAGSWLRIQELAEEFQTSAMPVREAVRRLAALGLVEVVPHRGARVCELSIEDLEDTYRTRLALEPMVVASAAVHFTDIQGQAARSALERHVQLLESGDIDGARQAHSEFHFLQYRAAGSRWLLRAIEPVWQNSERYRFASAEDPASRTRSHMEHVELLETCLAHNAAGAENAMKRHLRGAMQRMLSTLKA